VKALRLNRMTRILCAAGVAAGIAVTPVTAIAPPAHAGGAGTEDCVFVRPFFGPPTQQVTVSGCGMWPNEGVEILLSTAVRARTTANGNGQFSTQFAIPGDESLGARTVSAVGLSSQLFARTTFLVQNHP
jgi:hypothetical protein